MAQQLYDYDGKPVRGGVGNIVITCVIVLMGGIMLAMFLGFGRPSAAPQGATTSAPFPTSDPIALELARVKAQLAAQENQPAPVIVQSVPQGAAPQPVAVPEPAQAAEPSAPEPVVIVLHDGGGAPHVTGSGACAVAKGARRCGK